MSAKSEPTAKEKSANQAAEKKTLDLALSAINKQYGDGTLMRMGDATKMQVSSVSTGSVAIDLALGVGGLPRGRIVEIFGPESSGKTTLCLSIIAEIQRQGGNAVFVDVEHALDPRYSKVVGVDLDNLLVSQPESGEDALNIVETLIRSGSVLDLGIEHKILEKKGAWIAYNGQLIGQGREAAKDYLIKNPKVLEEIQKIIMEKVQVVGGMTLGVGVAENVTAE